MKAGPDESEETSMTVTTTPPIGDSGTWAEQVQQHGDKVFKTYWTSGRECDS